MAAPVKSSRLRKFLIGSGAVLGVGVVGITIATAVQERRVYEAPSVGIRASDSPEAIARGRYLVYGVAQCVACHGDVAENKKRPGELPDIPLTGGHEWVLPVGTFRAPNITSDPETGIGALSDEQLARMIRYGIKRDGRSTIPFMGFQQMTDEDLQAVISFLRTLKPVRHEVAPHDLNPLGHLVMAWLIKPVSPETPPEARTDRSISVARGRYLARTISDCRGCHTLRDDRTGAYIGGDFEGGNKLELEGKEYVTPNITAVAGVGRLSQWTEDQFVERFRAGRKVEGSPMSWELFKTMDEGDIRSIYRYIRTVEPSGGKSL